MRKIERNCLIEINKHNLIHYDPEFHELIMLDKTIYHTIGIDRIYDKLIVHTSIEKGDLIFLSHFYKPTFHYNKSTTNILNEDQVLENISLLDNGYFILREAFEYYEFVSENRPFGFKSVITLYNNPIFNYGQY